jgi:hypothetical protein
MTGPTFRALCFSKFANVIPEVRATGEPLVRLVPNMLTSGKSIDSEPQFRRTTPIIVDRGIVRNLSRGAFSK